ncbi:MAG: serine--tRNA ligase, partial [Methermicoccaceae archaeon]
MDNTDMKNNTNMNIDFHADVLFKTSKPIYGLQSALEQFFEDDAQKVLLKGIPENKGVRDIRWKVEEGGLVVIIETDSYLRAHDALLRLRKPLARLLGEKRIGIRGIDIREYIIRVPSPTEVSIKIPMITKQDYSEGVLTLHLHLTEQDIENRVPDRIVRLLDEKKMAAEYGGKGENWELIWESGTKPVFNHEDPTPLLEKKGWIKHGASRGQWIYGPQITKIFRVFEDIVLKELIEPLGYVEMIFPKLVPWEVWERSGHAKGVYPEIYYVCQPKSRDPAFWEDVMDYYKVTHEVPTDLISQKISPPIGGLCYAQCPPFWMFLRGETIADSSLPVKVFDRSGTSHRYESGGIHGIERVDEFHRIEIVWMDYPEQVIEEQNKLHECYHHIFEDILELEWRKAWVTPWFMAQEGMVGLSGDNRVGTTDYEAYLPYRGRDAEWLEFQNVSVNGEKYPKGFTVKSQSGETLWSGCSGVGLERWASAFFAQKGLDIENWPEAIQ